MDGVLDPEQRAKYTHGLLLQRLYHEDVLLTQRTYNFLTFNVFLAAVLVLGSSGGNVSGLWYVVCGLGAIVACLQVLFGRRMDVAISFWRQYLRLVERSRSVLLDDALFQFYKTGDVVTEWGKIGVSDWNRRAVFKAFPWNVMPSTNVMIGVLLPYLVASLWLAGLGARWLLSGYPTLAAVTLVFLIVVSVLAWLWPLPGSPQIIADVESPANQPLQPTSGAGERS